MINDRELPHNLDAERALLGAILIHDDALDAAAAVIRPESFYRKAHAYIFEAMLWLQSQRSGIDFTTLKNRLQQAGHLGEVGGAAYLTALTDGLPQATNVEHYAAIVREKAALRQLLMVGTQLSTDAYQAEQSALDLVATADAALMQLAADHVAGDLMPASELIKQFYPVLERAFEQKRAVTGLQTSWRELDEITLGLHAGNLILLAARPGQGKSVMAVNIAADVARQGHPVAFFSLEMSREELAWRLASSRAGVSLMRMRSGYLNDRDWTPLTQALGEVSSSPLFLDESARLSVPELRAKSRRLQAGSGLGLIVIDYLQLMHAPGRWDNRTAEVAAISRGLKQLARELKVPVLALSQLSRATEARKDGRPMLSDLRESGALEQDADLVWMLYRPEEYVPTEQNAGLAELIIQKHRNGPTGTVKLKFEKDLVRFVNWPAEEIVSTPYQERFLKG